MMRISAALILSTRMFAPGVQGPMPASADLHALQVVGPPSDASAVPSADGAGEDDGPAAETSTDSPEPVPSDPIAADDTGNGTTDAASTPTSDIPDGAPATALPEGPQTEPDGDSADSLHGNDAVAKPRARWEGSEGRKARKLVIAGSVALGVGGLLAIGAAVYGSVDPCNYRAGNNCFAEAQDRATATMAAPGGLLIVGGASMLAVGLKREHDIARGVDAGARSRRESRPERDARGRRAQVSLAPFVLGSASQDSLLAAAERRATMRSAPETANIRGLSGNAPRTRISGAGLMLTGRF